MLTGKIAVVTGASRGIGRAVAKELAKQGAIVIINYNGSEAKAQEVKNEIVEAGGQAEAMQCNVSEYSACEAFIKKLVDTYGRIDILVNNAGIVIDKPLITKDRLMMRMSEADFSDVIDVNLKGTFYCMKFASRQMMKQKNGRIINLSSVVGVCGNAGQVNYAASKAGVIGMTKSAAKELASRGITVNAIAPGFIETDMTNVLSDKVKEELSKQIPLGCLGQSEDVAKAAAFLASEGAKYITGQVLHVDGGMAM